MGGHGEDLVRRLSFQLERRMCRHVYVHAMKSCSSLTKKMRSHNNVSTWSGKFILVVFMAQDLWLGHCTTQYHTAFGCCDRMP